MWTPHGPTGFAGVALYTAGMEHGQVGDRSEDGILSAYVEPNAMMQQPMFVTMSMGDGCRIDVQCAMQLQCWSPDGMHGFPGLHTGMDEDMKRDAFLETWEDSCYSNSGNFNIVAWTGDAVCRSLAVHNHVQSNTGNVNSRWNNNLKGVGSLKVDYEQCSSGRIDKCNQEFWQLPHV